MGRLHDSHRDAQNGEGGLKDVEYLPVQPSVFVIWRLKIIFSMLVIMTTMLLAKLS